MARTSKGKGDCQYGTHKELRVLHECNGCHKVAMCSECWDKHNNVCPHCGANHN